MRMTFHVAPLIRVFVLVLCCYFLASILRGGNISDTGDKGIVRREHTDGLQSKSERYDALKVPLRVKTEIIQKHFGCVPKTKVMFLKTHKTGSSTITNIMLRFAYKHSLRVALPFAGGENLAIPSEDGQKSGGYPRYVLRDVKDSLKQFDILAHHWKYDSDALRRIMPEDTFKVTVVRDPWEQFKSALSFFPVLKKLGISGDDPVGNFFTHTKTKGSYRWLKDYMIRDLGWKAPLKESYETAVARVENHFDFVILTEYMDYGLVLLRRRLCWDIEDIIYLRLNEQSKYRFDINQDLVPTLKETHEVWSPGDHLLYAKLSKAFLDELQEQDLDFQEEVTYYRKVLSAVEKFCRGNVSANLAGFVVPPSKYTAGFRVSRPLCDLMQTHEAKLSVLLKREYYQHVFDDSMIEERVEENTSAPV